MPIFLICVIMFLFLLLIFALAWGGFELLICDNPMAATLFWLADLGALAAWIYILITYVIPKF